MNVPCPEMAVPGGADGLRGIWRCGKIKYGFAIACLPCLKVSHVAACRPVLAPVQHKTAAMELFCNFLLNKCLER